MTSEERLQLIDALQKRQGQLANLEVAARGGPPGGCTNRSRPSPFVLVAGCCRSAWLY
jgi:hypothetical protein